MLASASGAAISSRADCQSPRSAMPRAVDQHVVDRVDRLSGLQRHAFHFFGCRGGTRPVAQVQPDVQLQGQHHRQQAQPPFLAETLLGAVEQVGGQHEITHRIRGHPVGAERLAVADPVSSPAPARRRITSPPRSTGSAMATATTCRGSSWAADRPSNPRRTAAWASRPLSAHQQRKPAASSRFNARPTSPAAAAPAAAEQSSSTSAVLPLASSLRASLSHTTRARSKPARSVAEASLTRRPTTSGTTRLEGVPRSPDQPLTAARGRTAQLGGSLQTRHGRQHRPAAQRVTDRCVKRIGDFVIRSSDRLGTMPGPPERVRPPAARLPTRRGPAGASRPSPAAAHPSAPADDETAASPRRR